MIKKILLLISYLFKNNIDKSLEENITKLECNYCEFAFKPINRLEVCKINKKYIITKIHDEL